jgi:hypothetical protein
MWQATAKVTSSDMVQLQPMPTVDSDIHHVAVNDNSFSNSVYWGHGESLTYLELVSFAPVAYYAMSPSSLVVSCSDGCSLSQSAWWTSLAVCSFGWLTEAGGGLAAKNLVESGWNKLQCTIKATPVVVTQNLARPFDSYSHSAAQEMWDIGGPKVYSSSLKVILWATWIRSVSKYHTFPKFP